VIDWLRTTKSAYFYKKRKRLPKAAIVELFRSLRQDVEAPSNNIFRHVKEQLDHTSWSAIAFFYERNPAFLDLPDGHTKERICGFLILAEHREHIVLFRSNLDVPADFKTEYFQRAGDERVEAAIARTDATFEQIRLRSMATSKYALRSKTLEANDLETVVGPAGASRFVPRGYRVRRGGDHYTATPNTGRISLRSDRATYRDLIHWGVLVIDMLIDENIPTSPFIRTFARPIDLDSIPAGVLPTYIAIDVPALTEELLDAADGMRLVRRTGGEPVIIDKAGVDTILAALDQTFSVRKIQGKLRVLNPTDNNARIGSLSVGKTRIALRSLEMPEIEDVYVAPANAAAENIGLPIRRYIDQNGLYTILFNHFSIVYLDGSLYKDDSLTDGSRFLSYLKADGGLNAATSEKGHFSPAHAAFDPDSVFRILVDGIGQQDDLLICDDLGDEWADFIGINVHSQPKTISFYHAKHGALSIGASALHIAVSQAIKNLGRINLAAEGIAAKLPKWTSLYNNEGATLIPRVVRGDPANINETIVDALSSPDTIRRVFLVTSSLSRGQIDQKFVAIRDGEAPTPHFVQLYWLLTSYFSACAEVGAFPYVMCQE
jgi:hypothetical protein